jgi:hypothetical protein
VLDHHLAQIASDVDHGAVGRAADR